jgi:DNA invertase Pin-like site-specific DNA recombinase
MKNVYGYIRVSDKKQEEGVSLHEQKRILKEYAKSNNLKIIHFYEEKKTAAKRGRPLFNEMMQNLIEKKADGVVIHKIDRGSRNLHDWADIGDLIDNNISVFFAHENLNLSERGGRLSADIQAVMASDYVRNLRQEAIKGLYGRLKQGLYPWAAPIGYLNNGKGEVKTICPIQGKLVKQLFKLYTTADYNVRTLSEEMQKRGLVNTKGGRVCKNGITKILKNPFYIGIMKVKGQTFEGNHKPLITTQIFKKTQLIIKGRQNTKGLKHNYLFRRLIRCEECKYVMSGEKQKGTIYYRCQTKRCPTKSIREDTIEHYIKNMLKTISLQKEELDSLFEIISKQKEHEFAIEQKRLQSLEFQKNSLVSKEKKLLDAYLENLIEKDEFEQRKSDLLMKIHELDENINVVKSGNDEILSKIKDFLELSNEPLKLYNSAILEEKREMLKNITSNLTAKGKGVVFSMLSPYYELANRDILLKCPLVRDSSRTLTSQIIYTDKNTSGIRPKPLNKEQTERFFDILLGNNSILNAPNPTENNEISKDYPSTK